MLGGIACLAVFVAIVLLVYACPAAIRERLKATEVVYADALRGDPDAEFSPRTLAIWTWGGTGAGGLFIAFITSSLFLGMLGAVLAYLGPSLVLAYRRRQRRETISQQVIEMLPALANNLRSGLTVLQALEEVLNNLAAPLHVEIQLVLRECRYGRTVNEALDRLVERTGAESVAMAVTAIEICLARGGNLATVLDTIGSELREIARVQHQTRALTAEGRLQAKLIALAPFVLGGMMYFVAPDAWHTFLNNPIGSVVLGTAFLLIILGFLWMRKIVDVKV